MQIEDLPRNPAMLLSYVNTQLRDKFNGSLEALCRELDVDSKEFIDMMKQAGWEWNPDAKKFW